MKKLPWNLTVPRRLCAAAVAAAIALMLGQYGAAGSPSAQQPPQKKDEKKTSDSEESPIPPLKTPADDEWLKLGDGFDRIFLVPAAARAPEMGGRDSFDAQPLDGRPIKLKPTEPGEKLSEKVRFVFYGQDGVQEILRTHIKEIKYFEDFLLDQGQNHVDRFEMDKAFELYNHVANIQPAWPGLDRKLVEFWFYEAQKKLLVEVSRENEERALYLFHEMRQYCASKGIAEHPETRVWMGRSMERLVERAMEQKDYSRGRHVMNILEQDFPDHATLKVLRNRFIQGSDTQPGAERLRQKAKAEEAAGRIRDACFLIMQAADMWPTLPGIDADFNRIFTKYPVLHVAVRDLPPRFAPWAPAGSPDARIAQLLHVPLMEVSGVGENTAFASRVLNAPPELGELQKRLTLRVTSGLKWSDGEKPITAMDISRSISARTDPKLPSFDPGLASVLKSHNVTEVNEIVVDLKRIQLRPQTNFLFNVAPGHRLLGDRFDQRTVVGAGPFRNLTKKTGVEVNVEANQHFFGGKPKIAEIVERRYASGKEAVKAFLAGDVALLEHLPPKEYRRIEAKDDEFTIVRGAVPAVHAISFDFRTRRELKDSRTLRRAMVYALDRKRIFEEGLLDWQVREGNEVLNGPFPRGSFAFEPSLEPWPYEPVLAKGLVEAAARELGVTFDPERVKKGEPIFQFRMQYPDTEEVRDACRGIQRYWGLIGIGVDLVPRPMQTLEEEIAVGSRFELVYRIHYVRDPVLDAARVLCLGQPISPEGTMPNAGSAWLRQNLGELELAANWTLAINKLKMIQQQARDDVALIPLWQLTDYYAYHKRLKGVLDSSLGIYQDAENWQIEPWYRKDPF